MDEFPFSSLSRSLIPLVETPIALRRLDIRLLSSLRSTGKKDYKAFSIFAEIDPVSRTEIQPDLKDPSAHSPNGRNIASGKSGDRLEHAQSRRRIE